MKLKEFFDAIEKEEYRTDYIVKLRYKYSWEKEYTVENEYLEYDGNYDQWVWLHDWDEGQEDVDVLGYISIDDVFVPTTQAPWSKGVEGTVKFRAAQQDTPTGTWTIPGLHDKED